MEEAHNSEASTATFNFSYLLPELFSVNLQISKKKLGGKTMMMTSVLPIYKLLSLKGSDDAVQHSASLGLWTLSIVRN
jgi:hypothetical protein